MMPSQIDMDEMFDLDFALTMPETEDSNTDLVDMHNEDGQAAAAARRHMVDEMPTVIVSHHCTVCMQEFRSGEGGKQVHCGHIFHDKCIFQWLSIRDSCPLCRAKVSGAGKVVL